MKRHLTLTPALLVETILVTVLFGIGSALAMGASSPMTDQNSTGAGTNIGSANLEVIDYQLNFNAELTAVESVTIVLSNKDGAAEHKGIVNVALGNDANTEVETGNSAPKVVLAGATVDEKVTLRSALDIADMDWIHVVVEEA